jgi:hypothetical protein
MWASAPVQARFVLDPSLTRLEPYAGRITKSQT